MPGSTTHTPPPGHWPDWRKDLVSTNGVTAVAGIWLVFAPFALSYTTADAWWNDIVCGALIAAIGFIRIGGPAPTRALGRITTLAGVWILLSAFWLDDSTQATSNDLVIGTTICVLALVSTAATHRAHR